MKKIKHLEGLRGVAALVVLFCHLRNTCFITYQEYLISCIYKLETFTLLKAFLINTSLLFFDAEISVWVFWVLSSYVISILFFKKDANYDKILIGYFSKRYFRLFVPVVASIGFAYILLKFGLMYNNALAALLGDPYINGWLGSFYTFEPNFFQAVMSAIYGAFFNYEPNSSYNAVLWTIQNEFLGSLFTFSIFGILRHNSRRFIFYIIIMIVLLKLHVFYISAFVVGHVLCDYDFSNSKNKILNYIRVVESSIHKFKILVFIVSVLFIVFGRNILSFIKIPISYHNLILSVFVVYVCLRNLYYQKIFSSNIPFWLGNISFSLYLIHLPIICSLTSFLIITNYSLWGKIIASLTTIAVVLILSFFFTKYIDKKGVIYANRIGDYFKKYS